MLVSATRCPKCGSNKTDVYKRREYKTVDSYIIEDNTVMVRCMDCKHVAEANILRKKGQSAEGF